jgi:hypothetical protein
MAAELIIDSMYLMFASDCNKRSAMENKLNENKLKWIKPCVSFVVVVVDNFLVCLRFISSLKSSILYQSYLLYSMLSIFALADQCLKGRMKISILRGAQRAIDRLKGRVPRNGTFLVV